MKTLVLTLTILAGVSTVKAQQWQPKSTNKLPLSSFNFKLDTINTDLFKKDLTAPAKSGNVYIAQSNAIAATTQDRMPVAKLSNTDPGMAIVKTDKTSYNMPIVGKSSSRSYIAPNSTVYNLDGGTLVYPSK